MTTYLNEQFAKTENINTGNSEYFKQFIKDDGGMGALPLSLISATIEQIGGLSYFCERCQDIANHGASGGFNGFISSYELEQFFMANKKDIINFAKDEAKELSGYSNSEVEQVMDSLSDMILNFSLIAKSDIRPDDITDALLLGKGENKSLIYDVMGWYILETVSYRYTEFLDSLEG